MRSAKLRLHSTSDGTANGPAVYTSNPAWSETTINWNNGPAATSAATDDKGAIAANSWVEYDVTSFVTGNGTYSFRLATDLDRRRLLLPSRGGHLPARAGDHHRRAGHAEADRPRAI